MVSRDEDLGLSASVLLDTEAIKRIASSDKAAFDELMLAVKDEERRRFLHYTPYTKQMEFHSSHAVERILSGANQRIPLDSNILTPSGWVRSGDLCVGSKVYTHNGHISEIDEISDTVLAPLYRLHFNDGTTADCSDDHRWLLVSNRGLEFVRTTSEMACSNTLLRVPLPPAIEFSEKELVVPPYLVGLYLGNGWIKDGGIMMSDSYDAYCEIREHLEVGNYYESTQSFKVYGGKLYGKYLKEISGAKNKYIPDDYLRGSIEQRKELLAGLIDSDGHIDSLGRVCYYTSSERLAFGVCDLMRGLGCKIRLSRRGDRFDIRGRCPFKPNKISSKNEWVYKDRMDYKTKRISKIELIGELEQRCYRVKHDDHTYIIDDYVVTHNSGKSLSGCMETCFHLTGEYPEWWTGHVVKPRKNATNGQMEINAWVVGTDSKTVRDSLQSKIIGTEARKFKDGCIHPDYIDIEGSIKARGVPGLIDTVYIRHKSGCLCRLQFRSYEQGRENLQAATIDFVYCDEEPPSEVIGELRARIGATGGFMYMAFTPLKGMTPLVQEFWTRDNPDKYLVCMNIYEAKHYTPEKLRKIESLYSGLSESERKARMMGVPTMGSGLVYPIEVEDIKWDYLGNIPRNWKRLCGLDFGRGEHPMGLTWIAYDVVTDIIYVYDCEKTKNKSAAENSSIIKKKGEWIPVTYPHDFNRDTGVGSKYREVYKAEGLRLTPTHAQDKDGSNRVESGLIEIRNRMQSGRFKVARHLSEWFKEFQTYRYGDDGKPIKENDDILDSTRYAVVMLRYAKSEEDCMFERLGSIGGMSLNKVIDNTPVY